MNGILSDLDSRQYLVIQDPTPICACYEPMGQVYNTLRRWFVMKGGESAQISNPMISMVYSYLIPDLGRVVIGSHISFFCQL
jgi:hypothetical protein